MQVVGHRGRPAVRAVDRHSAIMAAWVVAALLGGYGLLKRRDA